MRGKKMTGRRKAGSREVEKKTNRGKMVKVLLGLGILNVKPEYHTSQSSFSSLQPTELSEPSKHQS